MQRDRQANRKRFGGVMFVMVILAMAGCSTPRHALVDGMPDEQYVVGGGSMIDWKAPTAGTAYLVEKTTGKIIETRSMEAGDNFGFSVGAGTQRVEFERRLGIEFSDMNLWLYFVPAASPTARYPGAQ